MTAIATTDAGLHDELTEYTVETRQSAVADWQHHMTYEHRRQARDELFRLVSEYPGNVRIMAWREGEIWLVYQAVTP